MIAPGKVRKQQKIEYKKDKECFITT